MDEQIRTLAFFHDETDRAGLTEPIRMAVERGAARDPVTHRIVVHPEFLWHPKMRQIQRGRQTARRAAAMRSAYATAIRGVLRSHPDAVVLTYPEAKEHHAGLRYDEERVIETAPREDVGGAIVGSLDAQGMRRLLALLPGIHPDDTFVIDGARLNCCPTQAAAQLTALQVYEAFAPPSSASLAETSPIRLHTRMLRFTIHTQSLFLGRMMMGVIGNGTGIDTDDISRQMMTDGTRIYD